MTTEPRRTDRAVSLQMLGVTKRYPGTLAVDNLDLTVRRGEVHALLGENGAGKSTLMKILAGTFSDYQGEIRIGDRSVVLHSPAQAKAQGIAMIHQEINLSLPQSVAHNLLAGALPMRAGLIDRKVLRETATRLLKRVFLDIDPDTLVESLGQHEQQLVEIAKALGSNPQILVMDEPTSTLGRDDVERLFEIIRELRSQGLSIIYISHHLSEVFEIADRATVLRDGKKVGTKEIGETSYEELIQMVVGKSVLLSRLARENPAGTEKVRVEGLSRHGFFENISFSVRAGEIVGLFGLMGCGSTEVARSIVGADPLHSGTVTLAGSRVPRGSVQRALASGVAYLTEDRKEQGLALRLDVSENVVATVLPTLVRSGVFSKGRGAPMVKGLVSALEVSPANPGQIVGNLSGGNQQKVLLAKWMAARPEFLILDEPTRGVDIGAKATIHAAIVRMADEGKAVLTISSDLPELISLCDRVLVMKDGRLCGELTGSQLTERNLLLAANGVEVAA